MSVPASRELLRGTCPNRTAGSDDKSLDRARPARKSGPRKRLSEGILAQPGSEDATTDVSSPAGQSPVCQGPVGLEETFFDPRRSVSRSSEEARPPALAGFDPLF